MRGWELETVALVVGIGAVLSLIAWRDGTRYEVAWVDVVVLGGLGVLWRGVENWDASVAGVVLGSGAIGIQVAIARLRGARQPVFAGDAMLMGAAGAVLGPLGLAVSWLLNVPAGVGYRLWLSRKRGRKGLGGYVPVGPAYCPAAGAVVLWQAVMGRNGW